MIWLFWHINTEDVLIDPLLLDVVIAYNWLNFGLVKLFLELLLCRRGRFLLFLEVDIVWRKYLSEWFLNCSNLMLENIFARGNLSGDASSGWCWVAPVQLFFALTSSDVPIKILCCFRWMTDILLLMILVQKVKSRLMRHLLHVTQALIWHPYVLYREESLHYLSPLCWLWSANLLGPKVSPGTLTTLLRCLGPSLYPFEICWSRRLHIPMLLRLLLQLEGTILMQVLFVIVKLTSRWLFLRHHQHFCIYINSNRHFLTQRKH